ncbi:MAG: DUF84 family protein [Bacillus sp. (in: Bacteria)]|nr:DUF84 family protein [Bacillus sp. (in: firmicutes)]
MKTKVYVGSMNPAKVNAVKNVLQQDAVVIPLDVPSSVSSQPMSDKETKEGAINRAMYIIEQEQAEVALGLEGGIITEEHDTMLLCNWGALVTKEKNVYTAGGARIYLPVDIAEEIRSGMELGKVIDKWAGRNDIRKKEGTIGVLTNGFVDRTEMFQHVVNLLVGQWKFSQGKNKSR